MLAFDNTYARLPERFYARVAPTRVRRPAGRAGQRGRSPSCSVSSPEVLGVDRRRARSSPATTFRPAPSRSRSPTRATSSAGSCPSSATGARFSWARSSAPTACGATSSSRAPDARRSRAGATDARARARCCASTSSARPWPRSASPRRAPWLPSRPASRPARGGAARRGAHPRRGQPLRVGTFEFFAARDDREALVALTRSRARASLSRAPAGAGNDALALLERVIEAQAEPRRALARRRVRPRRDEHGQHGHLRRDHRLRPVRVPRRVRSATRTFSSIDHGGRYAFGNQPRIAQWNMARFAETLLAAHRG